jgi:23S rRNA (adenine-N6)-dimethyltransferase
VPGQRVPGQHALASAGLAARLVADAGIQPGDIVVDIGAGAGALTRALAARGATVLAIELDGRLARRLTEGHRHLPGVVVLEADALAVPLPRSPFRVVANPPFHRTSALLRRLLDDLGSGLVRADLVVQWQVARARAGEGPADLLAARWGPWWRFRRGRRIPAARFRPPPATDAAVLVVERRDPPLLAPAAQPAYLAFVEATFAGGGRPPALDVTGWVRAASAGGAPSRPPGRWRR